MNRLPEKSDFKNGGQFFNLKISRSLPLPSEIMSFVFPDYVQILFKQTPQPSKKTLQMVLQHCLMTQKNALKEERMAKQRAKKDFETKQLEDKIKDYFENYYKNLYKNCTCLKKNH